MEREKRVRFGAAHRGRSIVTLRSDLVYVLHEHELGVKLPLKVPVMSEYRDTVHFGSTRYVRQTREMPTGPGIRSLDQGGFELIFHRFHLSGVIAVMDLQVPL